MKKFFVFLFLLVIFIGGSILTVSPPERVEAETEPEKILTSSEIMIEYVIKSAERAHSKNMQSEFSSIINEALLSRKEK